MIEWLRTAGQVDEARKVFKGLMSKYLDWPEAIFDAWIAFEQVHGSLEELEECLDRVERAQASVNAKRAKEAQKAYQDAQAASKAAEGLISTAVAQSGSATQVDSVPSAGSVPTAMEVDQDGHSENSKKRKADTEITTRAEEPNKKSKKGSFLLVLTNRE